jgi:hypothetical protein
LTEVTNKVDVPGENITQSQSQFGPFTTFGDRIEEVGADDPPDQNCFHFIGDGNPGNIEAILSPGDDQLVVTIDIVFEFFEGPFVNAQTKVLARTDAGKGEDLAALAIQRVQLLGGKIIAQQGGYGIAGADDPIDDLLGVFRHQG